LWAELQGAGVDVLVLVLGPTDTPALRAILTRRGVLESIDAPFPFPVQTPEHVASEAIANLDKGPTLLMGYMMKESDERRRTMSRSEIVRFNALQSGGIMKRSSADASASHK
jgi:short-subunit dehydrogenase